ncbi:hypothetical protein [Pleomorphomonas sp. PLEO]|uniref:hypothetical protein n=1 Tax=Pleomorphomonas sp. PLEO TaxID=3239306 RepID=UPI00351F5962
MARPRGSKNKPKSEPSTASTKKPELRVVGGGNAGTIGDNSDQQLRALTMHYKTRYLEALARKKEADAALKNACKSIKADLGDTGLKDIKLLIEIDSAGNNSIVKQTIEHLMRCAAWAGLPVGTQATLFDDDRRTLLEKAGEEGEYAGLNGKNPQSPHHPGSELDQAWMAAWYKGQDQLKQVFLKNNETKILRPVETQQRADDDDADAALAAEADDGDVGPEDDLDDQDTDGAPFDRPGRVVNGIEIVGEEPAGLAPAPDIKWPDGAGKDADLRPRHLAQDNSEL